MKRQQKNTVITGPISITRELTVSSVSNSRSWQFKRFPALRINGEWLRKAGFECGQQFTVTCSGGQLLVTPLVAPPIPWDSE